MRRSFSRPDASTSRVSAAKPTRTGAPAEPELGKDVGGGDEAGPPAGPGPFLSLSSARVSGRKSATAAAITTASASSAASSTARRISSAVVHAHHGGTRGRLDGAGPDHQRDRGPAFERLRRDGEPHLARRTVPDEADGVDRLPRRSRGHDDAPAGEIARRGRARPRSPARCPRARSCGRSPRPRPPAIRAPVRRCVHLATTSAFTLACVAGAPTSRCASPAPRTSGQVASSNVDVSRSSAMPCASLAMTFAVAGATTAMSASWASRTCRTTPGSSHRSV